MVKWYFEIVNKNDNLPNVLVSKEFRTRKQVEKWIATNIDYIDFDNYYADIKWADYDKYGVANREDIHIYVSLLEKEFVALQDKYRKESEQ